MYKYTKEHSYGCRAACCKAANECWPAVSFYLFYLCNVIPFIVILLKSILTGVMLLGIILPCHFAYFHSV